MAVHWPTECRAILRSARRISKALGHHEIITLDHVFFALLPHIHGVPMDDVLEIAAVDMPPWDDGAVYLSPGGQTPSLKLALEHAIITARSADRPVTIEDLWNGLPHGHEETYAHLVELFGLGA